MWPRTAATVLVAAAVVVSTAWGVDRWRDDSVAGAPDRSAVVQLPRLVPSPGVLVRSRVRADASLRVTQWIRPGSVLLSELTLRVLPAPGDGPPAAIELRDLRIRADARVLAEPVAELVSGQRVAVPFYGYVRAIRLDYVLEGAVIRSESSAPGRGLARLNLVQVAGPGTDQTHVFETRVLERRGGSVLSMACGDVTGVLQSCGRGVARGWQTSVHGSATARPVVSVVDLPSA